MCRLHDSVFLKPRICVTNKLSRVTLVPNRALKDAVRAWWLRCGDGGSEGPGSREPWSCAQRCCEPRTERGEEKSPTRCTKERTSLKTAVERVEKNMKKKKSSMKVDMSERLN